MRRIRRTDDDVTLDRPFCIFVEPTELPGIWLARIVGHGLDNCTQGEGPIDAVTMAADLLQVISGQCRTPDEEHDFSIPSVMLEHGEDGTREIPAWRCSRCDQTWSEDSLVDGP